MTTNTSPNVPKQGFIVSSKLYDKAKWVAMVFLPALSTLYFTLGAVWELPNVTQVIGTISALDVFLGVLLGLSAKGYASSDARFAGSIDVETTENDVKLFSLNLNGDPEDLDKQKEVTFKINPPSL